MQKNDIIKIVNDFLTEEFEINSDKLIPEANLVQDLDIESLDFVDIVVLIEKKFGFKVKREEMMEVKTLADLYNYIESKV
jgi:acyl carrier protein